MAQDNGVPPDGWQTSRGGVAVLGEMDPLSLTDVFPPTTLVGRCHGCETLILAHDRHEWANRASRELCWSHDVRAALYCGTCSTQHELSRSSVRGTEGDPT
jgi:hypothetical protein